MTLRAFLRDLAVAIGVYLGLMLASALAQPVEPVIVAKYRAKYGTPMAPNELVALLSAVASELNIYGPRYGILRKPNGHNCLGYSCDVVCTLDGKQYDALRDEGGIAAPQWNLVQNPNPQGGCEYQPPPVTPNPGTTPPTPEPEPCPSCPDCPPDQRQRVIDLTAQLAVLRADYSKLSVERDELLNRPAPTCEVRGSFWRAIGVKCQVNQP